MMNYLRLSINSIRCGATSRDKFLIFLNRLLHLSWPLVRIMYKYSNKIIFDPEKFIKNYKCKNEFGVYLCPGGNSELEFPKNFEPSVKKIIKNLTHGVFLDVGANIGLYTIMASKILNSNEKVIAVEPDPRHTEILQKNIELNNCKNVIIKKIAAWNKTEKLKLFSYQFGVSKLANSVVEEISDKYFVTDATPLDDILKDSSLSLIKIDVEHAELQVLEGLSQTLTSTKKLGIIFESSDERITNVQNFLHNFGFIISRLDDGNYFASKNYPIN